jgi:rhamnose utilization protein RhaD (predicted bifunctional aldolase and dehydrogenase)
MSTVTPLIDSVEDRWPAAAPRAGDLLARLVLASNLLGADRAVANFGGGNTSAKGTATDHAGRDVDVMWVKGSGSDLATMGPEGFTALRLAEVLPLLERDEMSDEDMVAYLARCQLDPAAPRCSIETLLHAFVPAPHVHHTHPDGINVLAGAAGGERLVRECFGDAAAWIPYIRPGFALSKQVGEAVRANPGLELVVLAKHGLVVWGDSAEAAYRRTIEVVNRAVAFVNERTADTPRFGGPLADARRLSGEARGALLRELLPAVRGAVSSERAKVLTVDTSPRSVEFVSSADAGHLVTVGAPCPDHLVHTKRLPLWIPYDPEADDAETLRGRIAERASAFRADYRAYVEAYGDESAAPADPDPRIVLVQHVGLVAAGTTLKAAAVSRDLYHRAIEVMAGAHALGGFVSLDAGESFAIEYWPLEL